MSTIALSSQPISNSRAWCEAAIIGCIGFMLFTVGIWDQEFVGFEVRFGLFAKEMLAFGPSIFPTTFGTPYPDYPATSTLLIWLLSNGNGDVIKLWAVLPTTIASTTTLVFTYRLLRDISFSWSITAVCFELLTITFLSHARSISVDQMVTTITIICFYLIYRDDTNANSQRSWPYWAGVALLLTLGFALRGPLGMVIPAGVINAYLLTRATLVRTISWRPLLLFNGLALLWLVSCTALLLYLANLSGGEKLVQQTIDAEVSGRLASTHNDYAAYYLVSSFGNYAFSYLPAIVVLVVFIIQTWRNKANSMQPLVLSFVVWVLILLIGLSIPQSHKARYLLPITPALAALASYPFVDQRSYPLEMVGKILRLVMVSIPSIALLVIGFALFYSKQHPVGLQINFWLLSTIALLCQIFAISVFFTKKNGVTTAQRDALIFGIAVMTFWSVDVWLWEPVKIQSSASRDFVQQAEHRRLQRPAPLVLYGFGKDSLANIYKLYADVSLAPIFAYDPHVLNDITESFYLVVSDENFERIKQCDNWKLTPIYNGLFYGEHYGMYFLHRLEPNRRSNS